MKDIKKAIAQVNKNLATTIADNKRCTCKEWYDALQRGTDHEGYGPAIVMERRGWSMSWALPDIKFCPWCGKEARLHPSKENALKRTERLSDLGGVP